MKLDTSYNPTVKPEGTDQEGNIDEGGETTEIAFMSAVESGHEEPKTFEEAWHHKLPETRAKWRMAIKKEIRDMIHKGVWRYTSKSEIPLNHRLVGSKCAFKVKNYGRYRARLCALGYSQVPGVDFTDNFVPVVKDETL